MYTAIIINLEDLQVAKKYLNLEQKGTLLDALIEYQSNGIILESKDTLLMMAFDTLLSSINHHNKKYQDRKEKNKKAINARWEKEKEKNSLEADTNVYECIPEDTNVYECIPEDTNVYGCIPEDTNVYECIPEDTNVYGCIPEDTNVYGCIQMNTTNITNLTKLTNSTNLNKEKKEKINQKEKTKTETLQATAADIKELLEAHTNNAEIKELFHEWLKSRKLQKKPPTKYALKLQLRRLEKLSGGYDDKKIRILETAIERGWQGLFDPDKPFGETEPKPISQELLDNIARAEAGIYN